MNQLGNTIIPGVSGLSPGISTPGNQPYPRNHLAADLVNEHMEDERREHISTRYLDTVEEINRIMYSGRLHEWQGMDLSISQFNTLVMLKQMGPMRMGMISYYLRNTLAATTSIVDRLERKDLVTRSRDPKDRRVVVCELTDQGQKATERFWRVAREAAVRVAGKWDLEQFESVVEALELILRTHKEIVQSGASTEPAG